MIENYKLYKFFEREEEEEEEKEENESYDGDNNDLVRVRQKILERSVDDFGDVIKNWKLTRVFCVDENNSNNKNNVNKNNKNNNSGRDGNGRVHMTNAEMRKVVEGWWLRGGGNKINKKDNIFNNNKNYVKNNGTSFENNRIKCGNKIITYEGSKLLRDSLWGNKSTDGWAGKKSCEWMDGWVSRKRSEGMDGWKRKMNKKGLDEFVNMKSNGLKGKDRMKKLEVLKKGKEDGLMDGEMKKRRLFLPPIKIKENQKDIPVLKIKLP